MKKQPEKIFIFAVLMVFIMLVSAFLASCGSGDKEEYNLENIKTGKIGCLIGSTTSIYLEDEYPDAEILQYNSFADVFEALRSEKVDYFPGAAQYLNLYAQKFDGFKLLDISFMPADIGFGVQKGNDKLRTEINDKLAEYKENGKLDELISHWDDCNNYIIEDIPVNTTGETIVVGTTCEMEPHNFVKDGNIVGIDIDIIGNILYDLGYQVKYEVMSFAATMPALSAGKIDVIAADLSITEERAKSIDFTDPYLLQIQSILVRDSGAGDAGGSFLSELKEGLYNNIVKEDRYKLILKGLGVTVALTLSTALFGTLLGILLCLMNRSRFIWVRGIKKVYSSVIEGIPMVVILMIVCYVILGNVDISGIIVGMLAFGMVFGNDVCGAIENGLNNVDRGQYEAVSALGFPGGLGFRKIILPQLLRNVIPVYGASFTGMIKSTAIAGYVAIQDLTKAGDIIRSRTFDAFLPLLITAVIYFVIIRIITLILRWIEKSGDRKRRKREVKL